MEPNIGDWYEETDKGICLCVRLVSQEAVGLAYSVDGPDVSANRGSGPCAVEETDMLCSCCSNAASTIRLITGLARQLCDECAAEYDDMILAGAEVRLVMVGKVNARERVSRAIERATGWLLAAGYAAARARCMKRTR